MVSQCQSNSNVSIISVEETPTEISETETRTIEDALPELEDDEPKKSFWQRRTKLEKVVFVACLIVLGLMIAIILLAEQLSSYRSEGAIEDEKAAVLAGKQKNAKDACIRPECIHTASFILNSINPDVEPCHDFYQFACGNFLKSNIIPSDKSEYNEYTVVEDEIHKKLTLLLSKTPDDNEAKPFHLANNLYKACMNKSLIEERGISPVVNVLERFGGWPVVKGDIWDEEVGDWHEDVADWQNFIKDFRKIGLNHNYMMEFSIYQDSENSSQYIIQLDAPPFGIDREYLVNGTDNKIVKEYYNYMIDMAVIFGADKENATTELKDSLNFEIELAKISTSSEERQNPNILLNHFTIADLSTRYPRIKWLDLINELLSTEITVTDAEVVNVQDLNYFDNLGLILETTSKRTITNYLMWRAVKYSAAYLNRDVRNRQLEFRRSLYGITELQPRQKECVDKVDDELEISISALYVRQYFNENTKKVVSDMIDEIRFAFKKLMEELDWMDDETRKASIEKLEKITSHIGYPDELKDNKKIEEYYENIEVDPEKYFESILNITAGVTDRLSKKLRQPVNKTDWENHSAITSVNAYYLPNENSIQFLAGYLQGKFFSVNRPAYMNYGSTGFTIGHEITHGFDNSGRQYDFEGNLKDWWSENTTESYLEKAQCIVDQYSRYVDEVTGLNLNGNNTQGENIADNGGIKLAYLAYTNWLAENGDEETLPSLNYTQKQLFWISAATSLCALYTPEVKKNYIITDYHVPAEFGVNGPIRNMKQFSEDFDCPAGSFMNPPDKCEVW